MTAVRAFHKDDRGREHLHCIRQLLHRAIVRAVREGNALPQRDHHLLPEALVIDIAARLCQPLRCALVRLQEKVVEMQHRISRLLLDEGAEGRFARGTPAVYCHNHRSVLRLLLHFLLLQKLCPLDNLLCHLLNLFCLRKFHPVLPCLFFLLYHPAAHIRQVFVPFLLKLPIANTFLLTFAGGNGIL